MVSPLIWPPVGAILGKPAMNEAEPVNLRDLMICLPAVLFQKQATLYLQGVGLDHHLASTLGVSILNGSGDSGSIELIMHYEAVDDAEWALLKKALSEKIFCHSQQEPDIREEEGKIRVTLPENKGDFTLCTGTPALTANAVVVEGNKVRPVSRNGAFDSYFLGEYGPLLKRGLEFKKVSAMVQLDSQAIKEEGPKLLEAGVLLVYHLCVGYLEKTGDHSLLPAILSFVCRHWGKVDARLVEAVSPFALTIDSKESFLLSCARQQDPAIAQVALSLASADALVPLVKALLPHHPQLAYLSVTRHQSAHARASHDECEAYTLLVKAEVSGLTDMALSLFARLPKGRKKKVKAPVKTLHLHAKNLIKEGDFLEARRLSALGLTDEQRLKISKWCLEQDDLDEAVSVFGDLPLLLKKLLDQGVVSPHLEGNLSPELILHGQLPQLVPHEQLASWIDRFPLSYELIVLRLELDVPLPEDLVAVIDYLQTHWKNGRSLPSKFGDACLRLTQDHIGCFLRIVESYSVSFSLNKEMLTHILEQGTPSRDVVRVCSSRAAKVEWTDGQKVAYLRHVKGLPQEKHVYHLERDKGHLPTREVLPFVVATAATLEHPQKRWDLLETYAIEENGPWEAVIPLIVDKGSHTLRFKMWALCRERKIRVPKALDEALLRKWKPDEDPPLFGRTLLETSPSFLVLMKALQAKGDEWGEKACRILQASSDPTHAALLPIAVARAYKLELSFKDDLLASPLFAQAKPLEKAKVAPTLAAARHPQALAVLGDQPATVDFLGEVTKDATYPVHEVLAVLRRSAPSPKQWSVVVSRLLLEVTNDQERINSLYTFLDNFEKTGRDFSCFEVAIVSMVELLKSSARIGEFTVVSLLVFRELEMSFCPKNGQNPLEEINNMGKTAALPIPQYSRIQQPKKSGKKWSSYVKRHIQAQVLLLNAVLDLRPQGDLLLQYVDQFLAVNIAVFIQDFPQASEEVLRVLERAAFESDCEDSNRFKIRSGFLRTGCVNCSSFRKSRNFAQQFYEYRLYLTSDMKQLTFMPRLKFGPKEVLAGLIARMKDVQEPSQIQRLMMLVKQSENYLTEKAVTILVEIVGKNPFVEVSNVSLCGWLYATLPKEKGYMEKVAAMIEEAGPSSVTMMDACTLDSNELLREIRALCYGPKNGD